MELQINKNKTQMVGVRLTEEQITKIKSLAEKEGVAQTEIIRALIDAALKELTPPH